MCLYLLPSSLGIGLKNLVLFTSLKGLECIHKDIDQTFKDKDKYIYKGLTNNL